MTRPALIGQHGWSRPGLRRPGQFDENALRRKRRKSALNCRQKSDHEMSDGPFRSQTAAKFRVRGNEFWVEAEEVQYQRQPLTTSLFHNTPNSRQVLGSVTVAYSVHIDEQARRLPGVASRSRRHKKPLASFGGGPAAEPGASPGTGLGSTLTPSERRCITLLPLCFAFHSSRASGERGNRSTLFSPSPHFVQSFYLKFCVITC